MDQARLFIRRAAVPAIHEIEAQARELDLDDSEPLIDIRHYWQTVYRHLRVVIGVTLAILFLVTLHLMGETPIFTAETTVLIQPNAEQGSSTLENLVEIETAAANADQYYKTQCAILESRNLAAQVVSALGLDRDPRFNGESQRTLWHHWLAGVTGDRLGDARATHAAPSLTDDELMPHYTEPSAAAVHRYLSMLKVASVPDTNLVKISFATPDPGLSAELANAHVIAYEREQNRTRGEQNEEARRFLRDKLSAIKDQLQKSEAALNDYRRQKGIIPGLISVDGKDAVVLDRLADLSKDLTQAQVARIALESQVQSINRHDLQSLPAVSDNSSFQDLQKKLNELYGQSAALASQFKPDYPPLAKLRAQISESEARLGALTQGVISGIQAQYHEAVEKERELQAEMDRQRAETLNLNDAAAQYVTLQREVDTNRELYNAVLTRIKDVAVANGAQHTLVSVINSAEAPAGPTSPRVFHDLILWLIGGLAGGVGVAFLLEFMDNTLKNPEEAEIYLRLPSLGAVPEFAELGNAAPTRLLPLRSPAITNGVSGRELISRESSYSPMGEAYRNLRTALLLSRAGSPPKTILITSATSREGKTVTSVNTAAMLAQLGPTLLIDADLRRARCHRVLATDNRSGLTEVLIGVRRSSEMIRPTEIEGLEFLPAGSAPPNPTELLGSVKFAELLAELDERFRYIVIDSSPVLPVSDAMLLARVVDGIVVVASSLDTPRQQVKAACARLEYARGKILGIVLNRIRRESPDFYYYYHSDYYSPQNGGDDDLAAAG